MRGRRILWVILILVGIYVIWVAAQQIAWGMRPKVALVRLSGPISESVDPGSLGEAELHQPKSKTFSSAPSATLP
jgi:hypothetical protein